MNFPVNLHIPDVRPTSSTLSGIARTLVENMAGVVETGILDATEEPTFEPGTLVVQGVRLEADPTANRNQTFQNKPGVVALLDDTNRIRDTVILPEGLVSVDWSIGKTFLCVLSGTRQSAFYMFHQKSGMSIDLWLANTGTNQLVGTWDAAIKWPGGTAPVMPAALAGTAALELVTIKDINNVLYGEYTIYPSAPPIPNT